MFSKFHTTISCGIIIGVLVGGTAIYSNALHAPFQFDDLLLIVENNLIKSFNIIPWLFSYDPSRFLTHLTFAINYHFGGVNVFGYHLVNVALHLLVTITFYFLLRLIFLKVNERKEELSEPWQHGIAAGAVFIFLAHPIQTQAVTYVAQRSTLLASLCYLLSCVFYIIFRMKNSMRYYFAALVVAFLGLFTKPIIVTLPLAFLLCEISFLNIANKKNWARILAGLAPFFLMAFTVPLLIMVWKLKVLDIHRYFEMTQETTQIQRLEYLWTQFNVAVTYLRLFFIPLNQNLDYDYPIAKSFWDFPTWFSFFIIAVILIFAIRIFARQKLVSFGLLWIFVTLSLESSVFPISDVMNEHRLYLPMAGFSLFLSAALAKICVKPRIYFAVICGVVLTFSTLTYLRNHVWQDRIGFLMDVARKSPHKARVHNNLGIAYADQGNLTAAEAEYITAIQLKPDFTNSYNNLANVYLQQGRVEEAIEHLKTALFWDPSYAGAYYNLGNVYWLQKKWELAYENYQKAVEFKPSFVLAIVALGKYFRYKGDEERAELYFHSARRINPDDAGAYTNLGDLYLLRRDYPKAIANYNQAIRCDPRQVTVYNSLGNVYDMLGQYDWAERIYKEALWRDQDFAHAYFNLANTLRKKGRLEEAGLMLQKAAELYSQQGNQQMAAASRQRLERLKRGDKKF